MQPDFERLYQSLHLQPGCNMVDFQHAYRRRLSELHPDKGRGLAGAAEPIELYELKLLYRRAMSFHAEHGRLPGAPPVAERLRSPMSSTPPPRASASSVPVPAAHDEDGGHHAASNARWTWLVLPGIVALVLLLISWPGRDPTPRDALIGDGAMSSARPTNAVETADAMLDRQEGHARLSLHVGMPAKQVAQLLGPPDAQDSEYWWYGPSSWVRVEAGTVQSWYSAPLHPLREIAQDPGSRNVDPGLAPPE